MGVLPLKWLVSTFLLLFNTLIVPKMGAVPQPVPEPATEPPPIAEPVPAPEPDPQPKPASTRLYVLMYHHFVPEGVGCNTWTLTDVRLREDLQWLAGHGWTTVLPSQLAAGEALPEKAVMLTFDDGYDSSYTLAYPILQEFQAKAAVSIIVSCTQEEQPGFLTWDMCREMEQSGLVEIGSHTYASHGEDENGIKRRKGEDKESYRARVLPDLQASIDLIEENLGAAPLLFAYPNGKTEAWAKDFIQEHFAVTVITRHGSWDISHGLYGIKRCNVSMEMPVGRILPS